MGIGTAATPSRAGVPGDLVSAPTRTPAPRCSGPLHRCGLDDVATAMATAGCAPSARDPAVVCHGRRQRLAGRKDLVLASSAASRDGARYRPRFAPGIDAHSRTALPLQHGIEAGGRRACSPDDTTLAYVGPPPGGLHRPGPDPGATYAETVELDATALEPQVAFPNLLERPTPQPGGTSNRSDRHGSCTNGRWRTWLPPPSARPPGAPVCAA